MLINTTPPPDEAAKLAEQQALLKQSLQEQSAIAHEGMQSANIVKTMEEAEAETKRLENRLASPVVNKVVDFQECAIGGFSGKILFDALPNASAIADMPERPHQIVGQDNINRETVNLDTEALKNPFLAGYYDGDAGEITINNFTFANDVEQSLKDKRMNNKPERGMLLKNNSLAQYLTLLHEAVHLKHNEKDGMAITGDTPENAARKDRLTETTANATEYLAVANLYSNLKSQGTTHFTYTTEIDGQTQVQTMPLENMLDLYPGLKDAYNKKGFDPKDPESVRNIVEASSKHWHEELKDIYTEQDIGRAAITAEETPSFARLVELAKDGKSPEQRYGQTAERMLKNIYIGSNINVGLSHCRDLLDTMSPNEAQALTAANGIQDATRPSDKTILAINGYLESKGIKTDEAKQTYLEKAFVRITARKPEADLELKNLLLQDGGSVQYTDGLVETQIPGTSLRTVSDGKNGTARIIGAFPDFTSKQETAHTKENEPQQNQTSKLSPIQLQPLRNQASR